MSYSFVGFIISCVVIAITPSMTVSLIIANTLKGGLIPGLITVLGGVIAILSMLIILIIGFDVVINSFSFMFFYIQLLGGLYLLYVGAQTIIKRHQSIIKPYLRRAPTEGGAKLQRLNPNLSPNPSARATP